jgi:hypothetical protein
LACASGRKDHALAGGLGVEQPIGLIGLIEPPTVGEELMGILWSATNSAQSAWPCREKVHEPTSVI